MFKRGDKKYKYIDDSNIFTHTICKETREDKALCESELQYLKWI